MFLFFFLAIYNQKWLKPFTFNSTIRKTFHYKKQLFILNFRLPYIILFCYILFYCNPSSYITLFY